MSDLVEVVVGPTPVIEVVQSPVTVVEVSSQPPGEKGDPGSDATVTAGSGITVTGGVVSAAYVSGSANNPHTSASATRNSDLPKNFWQCAIEPVHWLDGDEWIEVAL